MRYRELNVYVDLLKTGTTPSWLKQRKGALSLYTEVYQYSFHKLIDSCCSIQMESFAKAVEAPAHLLELPARGTSTKALRLRADVIAQQADMISWREHYHMHPELSFEEVETAAHVASLLRSFGIEEVYERVGRTGVVAVVRGQAGPGQCVALRADMDALPLPETADVPYKSKNAGKMHACGHGELLRWAAWRSSSAEFGHRAFAKC